MADTRKIGRFNVRSNIPIPEGRMSEWNVLARALQVGESPEPLPQKDAAKLATAIRKTGHKAVQRKNSDGLVEVWKGEVAEEKPTKKKVTKKKAAPAEAPVAAAAPAPEKKKEKAKPAPAPQPDPKEEEEEDDEDLLADDLTDDTAEEEEDEEELEDEEASFFDDEEE